VQRPLRRRANRSQRSQPGDGGRTLAANPAATIRAAGRLALRRPRSSAGTNVDDHPDVYGGTSRVNRLDLRAAWRFAPQWEWSLGADNVTDRTARQVHTLPQRVVHTGLRWQAK
jgi:outer membrane receptor protein involved in Fe transport